ncbi:phage tail protein [Phyllobacterium sp. TAF24]|uniref:phage tail protein n=1 Tax=Phyllobacterium sp. TAF24 TaxID=3233068 RepID=UPI003F9B2078
MPIFTAIAGAISAALFAGSALATTLISGALAFGAKLAFSYLNRPKQRKYSAVQGEIQYGADVPVGAMFGTGMTKGHRIFYAKYGKGNKFNSDIYVLSNGWCDGLDGIYFYGEKKTLVPKPVTGNETACFGVDGFDDKITIRFYDGRPGQGVDTKLVSVTNLLGRKWQATSVCAGLCYVAIDREYNADKFEKGPPEFSFILRGLRLYDPRKDSTVAGGSGSHRLDNPATWEFSKNPAVQRLNYQIGLKGQVSGRTLIGEGKSMGQLDLSSYFAAMNVSDTIRKGKPTYQSAIYVQGDDDHTEILKEFDDAMAGYGLNRRGLSGVIPGAPQIPVLDIAAADIPIDRAQEVSKRKSAFEMYNMMSGQFTSPESQWGAESLKPIVVNADIAADGRRRQTSNDFLQVSDPDIGQYLLNIRYRQNRKGGQATVPVSRRVGLKVQEGEWVTFDGKTWLITEWRSDESFLFTLVLSETGADIYSDGDIDPGPIIIPPSPPINPSILSTIQDFKVEVGVINGEDGFEKPALRFDWQAPDDPTITEVRFSYRITGTTVEFHDKSSEPELGSDEPGRAGFITSKDVQSGVFYDAQATITTVPDRFKTYTPWITTTIKTSRETVYMPGVVDGVLQRLNAKLDWIGKSIRFGDEERQRLNDLVAEAGAQSFDDRKEITATVGAFSASFSDQITVVASDTAAAVLQVVQLTARVNDPSKGLDALSQITDTLSATVYDPGTGLAAVTNRVNVTEARVGNFYANGILRFEQVATQAGAQSTAGLSVAANGTGPASQAALFLSAIAGGTSEVGITADTFYVVQAGAKRRPFIIQGGVLFADELRVNKLVSLSASLGAVDISEAVIGNLIVGTSNLGINSVTGFTTASGTVNNDTIGGTGNHVVNLTASDMLAPNRSLMQIQWSGSFSPFAGGATTYEISVINTTTGVTVYSKAFVINNPNTPMAAIDFFFGQNSAGSNTFQAKMTQGLGPLPGNPNTNIFNVTLTALWWKR